MRGFCFFCCFFAWFCYYFFSSFSLVSSLLLTLSAHSCSFCALSSAPPVAKKNVHFSAFFVFFLLLGSENVFGNRVVSTGRIG